MLFSMTTGLLLKSLVFIFVKSACSVCRCSNFAPVTRKMLIHMELPNDPMMLFSVINMKLRDFYPSLDALCDDLNVSKEDIIRRLQAVGFEYNPEQNKFW